MSKARDLANAGTALTTVSATELGYLDGVTSAVQTQVDAKIAKTLTTTTGDIIYASSANTPARLGIGSTDQILKVSGGVPTWATPAASGSMTQLASGTLPSSGNTDITSFSTGYKDLILEIYNYVNTTNDLGLRFNNDTGANQYGENTIRAGGTAITNVNSQSYIGVQSYANAGNTGTTRVWIYNYNGASRKAISFINTCSDPIQRTWGTGTWKAASAVTTVTIYPVTGTQSGTYALFGVN